jgi:two-component system, NtrC family, response regulator GlrR
MRVDSPDIAELRRCVRVAGIPLVGSSPAFLDLLCSIRSVARCGNATVLIRGETGTGKELIARAIHYLSDRKDFPFVPVNCGALPESLAENELFGHRSGAFTGASHEAMGLVKLAHNGTLFLDEIDALPAKVQVAVLRFLQDGRFLEEEVRARRFRQDLYYRLNVLNMAVPPLRARTGDAQLLSQHFLSECAQRYGRPLKTLHEHTLMWFDHYSWPGNVRELENLLHREYLLSEAEQLCIEEPGGATGLPVERSVVVVETPLPCYRQAKSRALQEFDRAYLSQLLRQTNGNITRAAQLAGKERRALGKLLKRYRIAHAAHG